MGSIEFFPRLLILGSSLLDLLLVLRLSLPLPHHAHPAAKAGADCRPHPGIARNCPSDGTERRAPHCPVQRTAV